MTATSNLANSGRLKDQASETITVYHGTNHPYDVLKQGCWVTLAQEEAINYARTYLVSDVLDGIETERKTQCWLLETVVARNDIEWKDGLGDARL